MSRFLPTVAVVTLLVMAALPNLVTGQESMSALAWLDDPKPVPDVLFTIEDGEARSLDDYRGKVIVLNFWAIWCPPCREEMPSLDRLQAALGGDYFVVMAMSEDRGGEEVIREFYEKIDSSNLNVFSDPTQKVARDFRVLGMPTTFIIDHNGRQVAKLVGAAAWDSEAALSHLIPLVEQAEADTGGALSDQASLAAAP